MSDVVVAVEKIVKGVEKQVRSRGYRAAKELRNAALDVLSGQRDGRVYKKPGTYGKTASKATRQLKQETRADRAYGHKLRGGQLYRASAPGEPPARRTGNLRRHWETHVRTAGARDGIAVTAEIENMEKKYAHYMEEGTPGGMVAPRPYIERIREKATPAIQRIYKEPYV